MTLCDSVSSSVGRRRQGGEGQGEERQEGEGERGAGEEAAAPEATPSSEATGRRGRGQEAREGWRRARRRGGESGRGRSCGAGGEGAAHV